MDAQDFWNVIGRYNQDTVIAQIELIYPAHGEPFCKNDLRKYMDEVEKVRLRSLK